MTTTMRRERQDGTSAAPAEPTTREIADLPDGDSWSADAHRVATSALQAFFHELSDVTPLRPEEEIELGGLVKLGAQAGERLAELDADAPEHSALEATAARGERAKWRMVEANLRLVASIARRYVGYRVPLEELIQEGIFGLVRAVEKFDPSLGFRFSTYATAWIQQAIRRGVTAQSHAAHVPFGVADSYQRLSRISVQMEQDLGRPPTIAELAEHVGLSATKAEEVMRAGLATVSLDIAALQGEDDGPSIVETIADENIPDPADEAVSALLRDAVAGALHQLKPREREVIQLRFGINTPYERTLEEISRELGMTREGVRQVEVRALAKLRPMLRLWTDHALRPHDTAARGHTHGRRPRIRRVRGF